MDDLSRTGTLVEEIVRRVVMQYLGRLMPDDYHRRALGNILEDLPGIVQEAIRHARMSENGQSGGR